jgi:hypothetical protein
LDWGVDVHICIAGSGLQGTDPTNEAIVLLARYVLGVDADVDWDI